MSADQFINYLMDQVYGAPGANCTNNNAPPKPPIPPAPAPYIEHNRAVILPSGTVLVNEEHNIVDINGQPIVFPDIPSARKMVRYLKEYTSNPFQRCINPWQGSIITIERWYTEHDEKNGIPAIELAETIKFLRTIQTLSS